MGTCLCNSTGWWWLRISPSKQSLHAFLLGMPQSAVATSLAELIINKSNSFDQWEIRKNIELSTDSYIYLYSFSTNTFFHYMILDWHFPITRLSSRPTITSHVCLQKWTDVFHRNWGKHTIFNQVILPSKITIHREPETDIHIYCSRSHSAYIYSEHICCILNISVTDGIFVIFDLGLVLGEYSCVHH